jgi:hypothetical protein
LRLSQNQLGKRNDPDGYRLELIETPGSGSASVA